MSLALVAPGRLDARTGGSIYDRRVVDGLRARGRNITLIEAEGSFPTPGAEALSRLDDSLAGLAVGTITVVDGLIFGCAPEVIERHATRLRLVALVHLPLAADPGLEPLDRPALAASEARAFRSATRIVITGPATQNLLETYDVPSERLALVEPGTDRPSPASLAAAQTERQRVGGVTRLLSVATVNPGKGHIALLGALAATGLTKWHLTCAGSLTRNPETATAVRRSIVGLGLSKHVSLLGDINEAGLETAHCAADVFVLATRRETYGMAVADALAWGLPVVSTHTGAIPDLVGDGAGIVVPVDSQDALTHALYRVLSDAPLRVRLATGALAAAERLPSWHDQVVAFERVLDAVP